VSRVAACGEIPEDAGEGFDVKLSPFWAAGVDGTARIETITRVEETTTYAVGLWDATPDVAEGDRDMAEAADFELTLFDGKTVHLFDISRRFAGRTCC
jgi:hypothetical protein